MHLAKLVKILKPFDGARLTRLKKYVRSPYFAVHPPSQSLLAYLADVHPWFPAAKMTVEAIAAKHDNLPTATSQVNAAAFLVKAIADFLALEKWRKRTTSIKRHELEGLRDLQLKDEFEKSFEKGRNTLAADTEQDIDIFLEKHLLTELAFNGFDAKLNRTTANSIMPVINTLDEYHALKKLRYLCEAINRQVILGVGYNEQHIPPLLKTLEAYTNKQYPYVYLFVNVLRMMQADTYDEFNIYYQLLKQYMLETSAKGLSQGMREALDYTLSRSLQWFNKGYEQSGPEYLWGIEMKARHNLLLDKEKLQPVTFRNMVSIAVMNGVKPEAIKRMISTYSRHLPAEHHDTFVAFAEGLYHYALKDFKYAIRRLLSAQVKNDAVFNCVIRRWHWMCLYEYDPEDSEALLNHISATEKYLIRNQQELQPVARILNRFITYSLLLLKPGTKEEWHAQFLKLGSEDHFPGKPWLLWALAAKANKTRTQGARVLSQ